MRASRRLSAWTLSAYTHRSVASSCTRSSSSRRARKSCLSARAWRAASSSSVSGAGSPGPGFSVSAAGSRSAGSADIVAFANRGSSVGAASGAAGAVEAGAADAAGAGALAVLASPITCWNSAHAASRSGSLRGRLASSRSSWSLLRFGASVAAVALVRAGASPAPDAARPVLPALCVAAGDSGVCAASAAAAFRACSADAACAAHRRSCLIGTSHAVHLSVLSAYDAQRSPMRSMVVCARFAAASRSSARASIVEFALSSLTSTW